MRDLDKAIKELKELYDKACKLEHIRNPLAYALYHVWKKYDK